MSPEFETNSKNAAAKDIDPSQVSIPAPYPINSTENQIQNGMDAFTEAQSESDAPKKDHK